MLRTVTTAAGEGDEGSVQMRFDGNEKRAFTGRIGSMVVQGLIFWKFFGGGKRGGGGGGTDKSRTLSTSHLVWPPAGGEICIFGKTSPFSKFLKRSNTAI